MKLQKSTLAAAVAATLALGMSGQAAADIYAGSSLHIDELSIAFLDVNNTPALGGVTLNSYNFSTTNTAILNGVGIVGSASCSTSNSCGLTPVLDGPVANKTDGLTRTNNQTSGDGTLTWFTVGGGNWSNSDSIIYTSEITSNNASLTHTDQIAESNISSALSASASSEILSVTGFTFNFSVGSDPVAFALSFLADPDMRAQILNDLGNAQSTMAVSVSLTKDGTGGLGQPALQGLGWAPDGDILNNNCQVGGSVTCVEVDDDEKLNQTIGTSTNNTVSDYSYGPNVYGLVNYGIFASGLTAGNWTLTLKAQTSTNLTRIQQVPEPGMLALLGIGLAGLSFMTRRRKA
jgi:hypothetical protein